MNFLRHPSVLSRQDLLPLHAILLSQFLVFRQAYGSNLLPIVVWKEWSRRRFCKIESRESRTNLSNRQKISQQCQFCFIHYLHNRTFNWKLFEFIACAYTADDALLYIRMFRSLCLSVCVLCWGYRHAVQTWLNRPRFRLEADSYWSRGANLRIPSPLTGSSKIPLISS